jgi:hypothetical protein
VYVLIVLASNEEELVLAGILQFILVEFGA